LLKQHLNDTEMSMERAGKAAGMSAATVSNIVNNKWVDDPKCISDDMWNKTAAFLRFSEGWEIEQNITNVIRIKNVAHFCKQTAEARSIIGNPGASKSETFKLLSKSVKGIFYIECAEFWNKKTFLNKLKRTLGLQPAPQGIPDMVEEIVAFLNKETRPLIIIDEADKLKDGVLNLFIAIYNETKGQCGFLLAGAPYLKQRIDKGVRLNKQSYKEIFSRLGGEFIHVHELAEEDVKKICIKNGLSESLQQKEVWNSCNRDLRRVKASVEKIKLEMQKESASKLAA